MDVPRELRRTRSVCPVCFQSIDARILVDPTGGYLEKTCPEHGVVKVMLSSHPDEFAELHDYYFDVMRRSYPQRDFIVRLTERCNLQCSICLASANLIRSPDYTLEDLVRFMESRRKRTKFDLMGAEPTLREDLPEIVREVRKRGHIAALHTNGLKLADESYVETLKDAGLGEVHLQFDGFDERYHREIRGRELNEVKVKALENLEKHGIAVDLKVTIVRGYNEGEIGKVLEYGLRRACVKEVFFLGCRALGRAHEKMHSECIVPDEVIDLFVQQVKNISRADIRRFQKLYFALLSLLGVRKCFYIYHYLIVKEGDSWRPVHEIVDLERIERRLERYRERRKRGSLLAAPLLLVSIAREFLSLRGLRLLGDFAVLKLLLLLGFDLSAVPRRAVLLGFITACDPYIYDEAVAANCGKGELSYDQGVQDAGALANVLRERDTQKIHEQAKS